MLRGARVDILCGWWVTLAAAALCLAARAQAPRPLCPRAAATAANCRAGYQARQNSFFTINGQTVVYGFSDGEYFALTCPPRIALDDPALPRFQPALRVREVRLECPPPRSSYAAALHAINVTSLDAPSGEGSFAAPTYDIKLHFNNVLNLDPAVLSAMPTLRRLTLFDTNFTAAGIARLPAGLEWLELRRTCIRRVPAAALARLPRLAKLVVIDKLPAVVEATGNLSSLSLSSPASAVAPALADTLATLTLWGWEPRYPEPWHSCAGLITLHLTFAAAEKLPDGWLSRCVRLRTLRMESAKNLTTLSAGALRGATALEVVWFQGCALKELPSGLLDHAPALHELHLSYNHLHTLPGDLFRHSASLWELYVSRNNLTGVVPRSLKDATSLSVLRLDDNPALDPCATDSASDMPGSTPLRDLKNLSIVTLARTGTRCVCADLRHLPRLARLDLAQTPLTRLTFADLSFNTTVDLRVDVYGTNVTRVELRREDYEGAPVSPVLTLLLGKPLRCDCALFWAAATLHRADSWLLAVGARCEDQRELLAVPLAEMVCAAPGPCPERCSCATREHEAAPGPLLRLDCAGAGLQQVPRVDARAALNYTGGDPVALDLRLADNQIRRLSPKDLPSELTALDLRNNSLGLIDEATASALVSRTGRRVQLAGNPLHCGCRASAALAAVRAHSDVFLDWASTTCSDGTPLALAAPQPCDDESALDPSNLSKGPPRLGPLGAPEDISKGLSGGAVAALALGLATVVALGLLLARSALRRYRRLQGTLPAPPPSPLLLERRRPDDDEWMYDAFISFAHDDETVVQELVERLEGGAAPLRLCVHYRDWVPGGWIPAQIAASVRVSRRTVAVVSEAFLRSKWARAEFREAYAAALEDSEPRLVLVLLEDPARLPLDAELRAYVSGNTYVRWGDPWFWRKLRRALPRASQPGPAPQMGPAPLPEPTSPRRGPPPPSASSSGT